VIPDYFRFTKLNRYVIGKPLSWLTLCLLTVGATATMYGQVAQQLLGRVTDPSGAVVPDAAVTVTDEGTGVVLTVKSGPTGDWVVPYLKPDTYTVKVDRTGFKEETVTGVKLDTGQLRRVDTKLQVGAESVTVSVAANPLEIQTDDADEKTVISGQSVIDLPENFRNIMATSIPVAGMGSKNGLYNVTTYSNISGGLVFDSSAGSLNIDGVSNQSTGFQSMAYVPLLDAVQEMVVDLTPYDAAVGGTYTTAGDIDVHLKSGTNNIHGTVYEYYKSTGLDANTYQNKYESDISPIAGCAASQCIGRPSHKSNQYGFEMDGPVFIPHLYNGHDKTFFMIAGEIFNQVTPGPNTFSVPGVYGQPSWLTPVNGYYQFGGLYQSTGAGASAPVTLYDPASINPLCDSAPSAANCGRTSFLSEGAPNSYSIPASRVNATALALLHYFPAPNQIGPTVPWQNNYFLQTSVPSHYKNFLIKIDHNISKKDRLTLRWGRWDQYQTTDSNGLPASNPARFGQFPSGQGYSDPFMELVHTFSPNAIFDFKASINLDENHTLAAGIFNQGSIPGFPNVSGGVTQPSLLGYFPQISLSSFTQMGSTATAASVHNELNILPSFTYVHRAHDIHIGLDNREYQISAKQNAGGLAISGSNNWTQANAETTTDATSGLSVASFLLDNGYVSGGSVTQPVQVYETYHDWAVFFEDSYKASKKLTLSLGVRYEFPNQPVDRYNRYTAAFLPGTVSPVSTYAGTHGYTGGGISGVLTFAGVNGQPRTQIPRAWYMIEPRFGFAYLINSKTVIRGGVGQGYNVGFYAGAQTGFSATTSVTPSTHALLTEPYSTLTGPGTPNGLFPSGYVPVAGSSLGSYVGLGTAISYYNYNQKFGSTWSYSLSVQRQLSRGDTLDVSYVGKQLYKAVTAESIDSPSPGWFAQCNAEAGGVVGKCQTNVANPFAGMTASVGNLGVINPFQGQGTFTAATINSGQLLLPFPQYSGVTENAKENRNGLWLNSLQFTETHRFSNSLTATATYEYARIMDNNGPLDYSNASFLRIQDSNDLNHRITFTGVYHIPVGRGRMLLGSTNRLVDAVVGGWNLGSALVYESGRPWQPQATGANNTGLGGSTGVLEAPLGVPALKVSRTVSYINGVRTIRAASPCVADRNATTGLPVLRAGAVAAGCTQANWTYKTLFAPAPDIVSVGIRLPASSEFDANLQKAFDIFSKRDFDAKFILRVDAFNVTNHPVFNGVNFSTNNDSSATATPIFGTIQEGIQAQSNLPRSLQLSGTIRW